MKRFPIRLVPRNLRILWSAGILKKSGKGNKNSPFQRTRWRFAGAAFSSAMSGSVVSPFAGLVAKVAGVDAAEARLVFFVAEVARANSDEPFMVLATGVDTGVLLGVRGTFFGVVGGDP